MNRVNCMEFSITERARKELERFSSEELLENEVVRINKGFKCGGPTFELMVDDSVQPLDKILNYGTFRLVVNEAFLQLLDGITLDFLEEGFVFEGDEHLRC
jgi:Fe-S cluster assembly iron-binding protein IscA